MGCLRHSLSALALSDMAKFCSTETDFYQPTDEGGLAWNDPETGIPLPKLEGTYHGTPSEEKYTVDGVPLISVIGITRFGLFIIKDAFRF